MTSRPSIPRRRSSNTGVGSVTYRQASPADMMGCARVFVRSSHDLARRMSGSPPNTRPADMLAALGHVQRTDPRGFHVAVKSQRIIAFAATIVRGNTHFLSMFWVLPGLQSHGVGRRVLARAFENPRPPASAVRCVFASLDTRAQMLYLKFGMQPRGMFYLLKGAPTGSPRPQHTPELVQVGKPGETTPQLLAIAARFDRKFRATRRDADIRFVMGLPGARVLDELVPERPLRLQHRSGRMWLLNSPALAALLARSAPPPGLERDAGGYTGRLFDEDQWLRQALGSAPPDFAEVSAILARYGVTGITDMSPRNDAAMAAHFAAQHISGSLQQNCWLAGRGTVAGRCA